MRLFAMCGHCHSAMYGGQCATHDSPYIRGAHIPPKTTVLVWTCPTCGHEFATYISKGEVFIGRHIDPTRNYTNARGRRVMPHMPKEDE